MIMPHLHARRDAGREGAKLPVHPWRMGSNASGASGSPRRMDADPFKRAIIDADKDRDGSVLQCHRAGRIRTPHLIRTRRDDCAVMDAGSHDARCPNDYIREGLINSCLHEKLCSWVNAYGQSGGNLLVRESLWQRRCYKASKHRTEKSSEHRATMSLYRSSRRRRDGCCEGRT
jgi:hypothetical protein